MTFVQILGQCRPLVQQYRVMLEYFLLQCLAENRVSGKLLSVLLAVFTDLTTKVAKISLSGLSYSPQA